MRRDRSLPRVSCFVATAAAALTFAACQFDAAVPARSLCTAENPTCPQGFTCRVTVGLCVSNEDPDRTAPTIVRARLPSVPLRRGDLLHVEVDVSEPLGVPPSGSLSQHATVTRLDFVGAQELTYSFERQIGQEEQEGLANVSIDLVDGAGNAAQGLLVGAVTLDFSAPQVGQVAFIAPPDADGGFADVRLQDPVAVRVLFSEPVRPSTRLVARSTDCADTVTFTTQAAVGGIADFVTTAPAGRAGCTYALELQALVDLAGNEATPSPLPLDARYAVDADAPAVRNLASGRALADGGWLPATTFSRVPPYDVAAFRFDVDLGVADLTATFDGAPLAGCTLAASCVRGSAGFGCQCARPVAATDAEGTAVFALAVADSAGNARSVSTPIRFDFTAPHVLGETVSVVLQPAPGAKVPSVGALTSGAAVRVSFTVDEPGVATLRSAPTPLTFTPGTTTRTSFLFHATLATATAQGAHQLTATCTDDVGNQRDEALPTGFDVDTVPPSAPQVESDGGVVYRRVPWGAADAGVSFDVTLSAGAAEAATTLLVTDVRGSEAGRGLMPAQGGVVVPLSQADRSQVFVTAIDAAGNESPAVEVHDVVWRASLRGKVLGDPSSNPNALELRGAFTEALDEDTATERLLPATGVTQPQWRLDATLGHRSAAAMVYDSRRGKLVQYGGNTATSNSDQVYEFDGFVWSNRSPPGPHPALAYWYALTYDSARGKTVAFGGYPNGYTNELWEYDGTHWEDRTPPSGGPVARVGHSLAYDAKRQRVVLYGGQSETASLSDCWEWDGATWVDRTTATRPGNRFFAAMAYDAQRERTVLFGGATDASVWEWDGTAWTRITPTGSAPVSVSQHALVYDSVRQVVLLFGGAAMSNNVRQNSVWEWNGATWTNRTPTTGSPAARASFVSAFDDARGVLVISGGIGTGALTDQWEWNGTAWANRSATAARPAGTLDMRLAHDTTRGTNVLFGASTTASSVWEITNGAWANRTDAGIPSPRFGHALTYDPVRQQTLSFGGYTASGATLVANNELWAWNGTAWTNRTPAAGGPSARLWHMLTFDTARGLAVLFGGQLNAGGATRELWEWNGSAWTNRTPASGGPAADHSGGLSFDSARRVSVLYGGSANATALWEWNGTSWRAPTVTGPAPRGRGYHGQTFDPVRATTVVFGGLTDTGRAADVWSWDGTQWKDETPPSGGPEPREVPHMTFDDARGVALSYGGDTIGPTGVVFTNELWAFGRITGARPQGVVRFRFAAAGAAPAWVRGVAVTLQATGAGRALRTGAAVAGVEVGLYDDRHAFVPRQTLAGAAPLTFSLAATELQRSFVGPRQELAFGLAPVGADTRQGAAQLTVEDAEVEIAYRRP